MLALLNTILVITIYVGLLSFLLYYVLSNLNRDEDDDRDGGWQQPEVPPPIDNPPSLKKDLPIKQKITQELEHELV